MRTPKWQKRLNKSQLRHLREVNCTTLAKVKETILYQKELKFPCLDCVDIGHRLGILSDGK
jgi:hypothetical protein